MRCCGCCGRPAPRAGDAADGLVGAAGDLLASARDAQVIADTLAGLPVPAIVLDDTSASLDADAVGRAAAMLSGSTRPGGWLTRRAEVGSGRRRAHRGVPPRPPAGSGRCARSRPTSTCASGGARSSASRTRCAPCGRGRRSALRPYAERLAELGSLLGDDHDLANAAEHLGLDEPCEGSAEWAAIDAARARQRVPRDRVGPARRVAVRRTTHCVPPSPPRLRGGTPRRRLRAARMPRCGFRTVTPHSSSATCGCRTAQPGRSPWWC